MIKLRSVAWIIIFFLFSAQVTAHAKETPRHRFPHDSRVIKLIEDTFYSDGHPSQKKIAQYRTAAEKKYHEIQKNLTHQYVRKQGTTPEKACKKVQKKNECCSYEILLDYIKRLEKATDTEEFRCLAIRILELDYALKIEGKKLASTMLFEKVPASLRKWKMPIHSALEGEASNLVNPETGTFFTQEQLVEFKRRSGDVSKLNPPADSTFWTNHAVSHIDVRKHYQEGGDALHKGIEIVFPTKKAYFEKIRKTQTKPKMDLYFVHQGEKLEYKLKIASEVHSEITCAALYAALGFSVDISKYVRDFKVVLGDVTHLEFQREWESYFSRYDLDKLIKDKGRDQEGNYIIFHEGLLEAKPEGLIRVGPWAYGCLGHRGMREVRGSIIYNMWVANQDLKEAENNKLIIRKEGGRCRFFHIQHDMGFAFGSSYIERPGAYSWDIVKKRTDKYIHVKYRCFQKNSGFKHVTYADARWMVRLIARLTRRQIIDAVELGGWPESMGKLLVEKLISRRNQLVEAYELLGEKTPEGETIKLLPFDRRLTTPDRVVVNGKLKIYRLPGYPQYFGPRLNEVVTLILKGLRNMAVDSVVGVASSIRYITLDPEEFGLSEGIVSKIILRMGREIELNPKPRDESESYLVKDSMEIGFRLGYGYVLSGDIAYSRKYTLVYPVPTRDAGRFHDRFILSLFLPFKQRSRHMPRCYVIITEDFLEGRGKVRLRLHDSPVELALTASRVLLQRHLLSNKDDHRIVFLEDNSLYKELKLKLYLEFLRTFRIHLFKAYTQKGLLDRNYVEMDVSDIETSPLKEEAIDLLLGENDPSLFKKIGKERNIKDRFLEKKKYLTIFDLLRQRSVFRMDKVDDGINRYYQVESRKVKEWRFLDNGERHFSSIRFSGKTAKDKSFHNPMLTISLQVNDRSTFNRELKWGYLHFINTLALKKDFIDFDPCAHTVNGIWGSTQVFINFLLYKEGLENLIKADAAGIWQVVAEVTGKSVDYWQRQLKNRRYRGRPVAGKYSRSQYLAVKTCYFIKALDRAGNAKNSQKKMRLVVNAIQKAIYNSGHMYNPVLLTVIHRLAGTENIYFNALVTVPENKENMFPARVSFYNETGTDRKLEAPIFPFIFEDPSEIYHLF